jgi:replicative DNA helicase
MTEQFNSALQYLYGAMCSHPEDGKFVLQGLLEIFDDLPINAQRIIEGVQFVYSRPQKASAKKVWDYCNDKGYVEVHSLLQSAAKAPSAMLWKSKLKMIEDEINISKIKIAIDEIKREEDLEVVLDKIGDLSKFSKYDKGFFSAIDSDIDSIISGKSLKRISTGYPTLDMQINGGLPLGDVSVVAGSTGSGKSAFCLNIAYHAIKSGSANVTIYSLEMTSSTNLRRLASIHSGIPARDIGNCEGSKKALSLFSEAYLNGSLRIRSASTSLSQIRNQTIIDSKWSDKPNIVLVDYTGLVDHKSKNSYERMSEISRELRQIALDSGSAILEVIQLNREYRKHNDLHETERAPILSDLRDSGQIEQDASVILMIHSPKTEEDLKWKPKEVWIRKNRDGTPDVFFRAEFDGPTFTFRERVKVVYD